MVDYGLRAVLVSPNRELASELRARLEEEGGFEVVCDLESYPGAGRMSAMVAQHRPDVVLLDASDLVQALPALGELESARRECPVIAFARRQGPEAVMELLRSGAFDYVEWPFPETVFREVVLRLHRHRAVQTGAEVSRGGRVVGFASSKPGSGATTLARQTAFALRRVTGKQVLLVDLNVMSGTSATWAGLDRMPSIMDALAQIGELEQAKSWDRWAFPCNGIRIVPAPAFPQTVTIPREGLRRFLESARRRFDCVVLDLPSIVDSLGQGLLEEVDNLVAVATPELTSLYLMQRHIRALLDLGMPPSILHLALNRVTKRDALEVEQVSRMLKHKVEWAIPNDYFSLHAAGQLALTGDSALAQGIRQMAANISGSGSAPGSEKKHAAPPAPNLRELAVATH